MKGLKLFFLTAVAAAFVTNAGAQTMSEASAKYAEAGKAMTEKRYDEAAKGFEETIKMAEALGEEGIKLREESEKYLVTTYLNKGRTSASAKNYDEAVAALAKAQELANKYNNMQAATSAGQVLSQVYLIQGGEAYNSKDYATAAEVFAKGYAAAPNNTKLALYLAESYDKLGDFDKAVDIYKGIMALTHSRYAADVKEAKESLATALLVRATEAAGKGNYDEVVKYSDQVLEFDPANQTALLLPLQVATNAKKYNEVVKRGVAAEAALTDDVQKANANFYLGMAYQNLQNNAKALEHYKKVTAGDNAALAKQAIADINS